MRRGRFAPFLLICIKYYVSLCSLPEMVQILLQTLFSQLVNMHFHSSFFPKKPHLILADHFQVNTICVISLSLLQLKLCISSFARSTLPYKTLQWHVWSGLVLGYKYFIIHSFLPLNFNDVLHTLLRGSGVLGLITNLCGTCKHKVTFILYFCFGYNFSPSSSHCHPELTLRKVVWFQDHSYISSVYLWPCPEVDRGGGCRGCAPPPPEMTCGFLIQLVFCKKKLCGLLVFKWSKRRVHSLLKKILDPPLMS